MNNTKYTFRIEKNFSLTWRTSSRAVGWGSANGLAELLRHYNRPGSKRPYKLDLSKMPTNLSAAQEYMQACLVVQDELCKLTEEEWQTFVLPDPTIVAAKEANERAQMVLPVVPA